MKKLIIFFLSLAVIIASCNQKGTDKDVALIEKIGNNLMPAVIIEGDTMVSYSIYERMEHYNVPGVSIAFINDGEIKWAKGYGYLSADSNRQVDENTLFQAASISKPVAALAALQLVEEGKLGLDDDVNQYLKAWQLEENEYTRDEKVTLRRILSHSAGLTVHGFGGYSFTDTVPGIIQVLNGEKPSNSGRIYPDTIPGSIYRYSGGGYTVMQKMLTDMSGMDFPELMEKSVLSEIGMTNSTYQQPLPAEYEANAAAGHEPDGSMVEGRWHTYPEMAAAGLWTTPTDLLRYALEVQNSLEGKSNSILSQWMTEEMLTPQMNSHGLGPGVSGEGDSLRFSHGGANKGYRCQLMVFARNGQGVAIMTNSDNGGQLIPEIMRSFSHVYNWSFNKPLMKRTVEMTGEVLNSFTGNYSITWQGNEMIFEIKMKDDHLHGTQQWDGIEFDLYPESDLVFFNIDDGTSFEFIRTESGEITELVIRREYNFKKKK
ncbi:MAG TPA: serine hydrolase [Bacteroidetes bacterium]|nr:serine hydrolase [Bacteroidota bacterium]